MCSFTIATEEQERFFNSSKSQRMDDLEKLQPLPYDGKGIEIMRYLQNSDSK